MDWFKDNLQALRAGDAPLAQRMERLPLPPDIAVGAAKNGGPVPQVQGIWLHSSYQPAAEAQKLAAGFCHDAAARSVVYGLGFGYHVLELLRRIPPAEEILVIEPSAPLFRAFLSAVDIRPFLPRARFAVAAPPPSLCAQYGERRWNVFTHKPSCHIAGAYFAALEKCRAAGDFLDKNKIKVLVVNPIYGGSLPTARFCATALAALGHEVAVAQCEEFAGGFFATQNVTKNRQNSGVLSQLFMNLMNEVILAKAAEFKPDLVLALAQAPLSADGIARLRNTLGIPVAFWFVEDFRTLPYWRQVAAHYDHFFAIQQDDFFAELRAAGVSNYHYLPQAACRHTHRPLLLDKAERDRFAADVSFMGAAYYNRTHSFPQLLEFDFKIWGTGWDLTSPIGQRTQNKNERVSTEDCVRIYNAAAINLNLHSSTYHEAVNPHGDFVNPRAFEIAACGGFQLADARSELGALFREGEEIVTFRDFDELKKKIRYYLAHEEERRSIAARGRERVLRDHTFERRLRELLICVFQERLDGLRQRVAARQDKVEYLIGAAGAATELGEYLAQFRGVRDFTLKTVTSKIEDEKGALNKNELLLLMVDQVIKEVEG